MPRVSDLLVRWFTWYARRYVRRHFHSLQVSRWQAPPPQETGPLVIYCNHASWWDPLVCALIAERYFAGRRSYAPMDAHALEKYRFFKKMGFFPVEQANQRGAIQFLRASEAILQDGGSILWVTPQGRFADIRERPLRFRAGLGHLPGVAESITFVPLAIEYVFGEERLPEILVRFGRPHSTSRAVVTELAPEEWTRRFEQALQQTQDELAEDVIRREPGECLLRGRAGVGGIYDGWRQFCAWMRGQRFSLEHGAK